MNKLGQWIKRIFVKVLKAFFWSGGNPVVAEVEAVKEVATIVVEEVTHHDTQGEGVQKAQAKVSEVPRGNAQSVHPLPASGQAVEGSTPTPSEPVKPGPTTFDKPVDQVYGKNRKH
jgi:hypothetical protein